MVSLITAGCLIAFLWQTRLKVMPVSTGEWHDQQGNRLVAGQAQNFKQEPATELTYVTAGLGLAGLAALLYLAL